MQNWHLIQQQPFLKRIIKFYCLVQKGQIPKDILVRAELLQVDGSCAGLSTILITDAKRGKKNVQMS